ncbi:tRNA pseudouridine(38-40) synthase TruA [uncultured Fusobacterium sp.]|uniref:tRNA pseudouridine(38-40) synthase TruA n=1 Tax=uncultured Fusobacterium sp. TaxID=159267 RepID=UPI0025EB0DC4|nr:tRNA pseudouridine(38-40) synthase TruA [uncultured Fusobacterium sp.]
MRNIKLTYRYDGSLFYGFQRQPEKRTVQGEIEKLLNVVFKKEIDMISSGRTDRGVHALIQVSNFYVDSTIPIERLKYILNRGLPLDIELLDVEEVEEKFNSRFDAKNRGYRYIISWERNPFRSRYETFINREIDIKRFYEILKPLIGIHDFNNFRLSDCGSKTSVREIYDIKIEKLEEKRIAIDLLGSSFLKSQIRIIIGTALNIYFKELPENYIEEMLKNPNKKYLKKVAPPYGLYLSQVNY